MGKYKEFIHNNAPDESQVEEDGLVGTYLKHLQTYTWIQGNPAVRRKMRNHPGVKTYRHINLLLFLMWMAILMIHACTSN
jgi:hypothetical protein